MIDEVTKKDNSIGEIGKLLKYAVGAAAVLYLIMYLAIALARIKYPFELEWMEGGMIDHVRRILSGEQLYVSPSLDFIPYIYTPLYYYFSAMAAKITGIGFFPLRLVSFIASLGCFCIIYRLVKRETDCKFYGIIASGLFAATFRISGAWFDIARVDSLFVFLLLLAIYLVRFGNSVKTYIIAGIFVFLSFFTKQIALFMFLPVLLYSFINNWRYTLVLVGLLLILVVGSTLYFNSITDGWYTYYIFNLPAQHSINTSLFGGFWGNDIIARFPIACLISLLLIPLYFTKSNINARNFIFYFLVLTGMIIGSLSSRLHRGGWDNVLIPAYAGMAISTVIGISEIFKYIKTIPENKQKSLEVYIYIACIIQFVLLIYNPIKQIPTQKDVECGKKLINVVKEIPGEVIIPYHGYLTYMAGKKTHAHAMALFDIIFKGDDVVIKEKLRFEIIQAIKKKRFSAIIIDYENSWWFQHVVEKYYTKGKLIFEDTDSFWPVTGMKTRPEYIYIPENEK